MRMGLPVHKLILATNENNILTRFICQGDYSIGDVRPSLSPSMDIQKASNFERYLYYLYNGDCARVRTAMQDFAAGGKLHFSDTETKRVAEDFLSLSVDSEQTLETIADFHEKHDYVLDPHTAVGVRAGKELAGGDYPVICLATAHPAKFGDAVKKAIKKSPSPPASLQDIEQRERRCETLAADTDTIKEFLRKNAI